MPICELWILFAMSRLEQAQAIIAEPHKFKVCLPCGSIVPVANTLCGICRGYRFDADEQYVVGTAFELGSREKTSVTQEDFR